MTTLELITLALGGAFVAWIFLARRRKDRQIRERLTPVTDAAIAKWLADRDGERAGR